MKHEESDAAGKSITATDIADSGGRGSLRKAKPQGSAVRDGGKEAAASRLSENQY